MPDKTILVAEDNQLIRMMVQTALRPLQCRVIEAVDGGEALELIKSEEPDLVLLDITMPELDGFGVLEELCILDTGGPCPIVMLTSAAGERDMDRAKALGARDHIVKPFEPAELRNTVARLLGVHP